MKKNFILTFVLAGTLLLMNQPSFSQGMINNGATIIITTGANVYIDGDALGKYTNQTNAGSDGKIDLNGNMYVEGDWVNNATGNNVFINNTAAPWGTIYLNGAVASNITGSRLTEFENLYVQNAYRTLQITDCEVNNILTADNTGLILNQKKFIIDNPAGAGITAVGTGHVRSESTAPPFGEIQWNIGASTGINYVIPFGTVAPIVIPFTFNPTAGTTGNMIVATYPTNAANIPYPPGVTHVNGVSGGDNSALTVDRFWEIVLPGPLTSTNVNFRCTAAEATGIPNPRAQRWIPGFNAWELPYQGTQSTAAVGTDVVGMTGQTTWWTLADITSPLPVEMLSFKAECKGKEVDINWVTASEKNNKSFILERSSNGSDFEVLLTVNGTGTTTSTNSYEAFDKNPFNGFTYYMLKQVDFNGNVTTFDKTVAVRNCNQADAFYAQVISNPGEPSLLVNIPASEKFTLTIFDASGRLISNESVDLSAGVNYLDLKTDNLSAAVYLIKLESKTQLWNKRFLISGN